jgi:arginine decarboxylase
LPIFLFGDEVTAEMVPSSVLKHANAFMRLFEDSFEFMARAIARAARLYLDRLPPPMFKALMDYTLHASYSWHTPGHGGGVAFRKSPVGQLFYQFFGENTLRSDISVSVGQIGSLLDHTGPIAQVSEMRRASSAPTKPYSSSAAPPQRTRSSGTAR